MDKEWNQLDLIDLLSERYVLLRSICEDNWNQTHDIYLSNSEWFIMARVYKKQPTISQVSKRVYISRQATHKIIKSLHAKELLEVLNQESNKKDKVVRLTPLGEQYFEENARQKAKLEQAIADQIGPDKVSLLKELLKLDWGLSSSSSLTSLTSLSNP